MQWKKTAILHKQRNGSIPTESCLGIKKRWIFLIFFRQRWCGHIRSPKNIIWNFSFLFDFNNFVQVTGLRQWLWVDDPLMQRLVLILEVLNIFAYLGSILQSDIVNKIRGRDLTTSDKIHLKIKYINRKSFLLSVEEQVTQNLFLLLGDVFSHLIECAVAPSICQLEVKLGFTGQILKHLEVSLTSG